MKKIALALTALLILAGFASCSTIANERTTRSQSLHDEEAFNSACRATLYPHLCVSTLQAARPRQIYQQSALTPGGSMKDMATISVEVSLQEIRMLISDGVFSELSQHSMDDDVRKGAAVEDCKMLFQSTLHQLNESLQILRNSADDEWKKEQAEDVRTWLSASLTDLDTCMQRFQTLLKKQSSVLLPNTVRNVYKVVSNSLAIVSSLPVLADFSPSHNNRRLLVHRKLISGNEDFPRWMSPSDRRLLQASPAGGVTPNVVVAKDGTGNYNTISEAVEAAPSKSNGRYVILVKAGVYAESVDVSKNNIMLIGDGKDMTVVTGSKSGASLKSIATFAATGDGFIARDMGFENTAGADEGQAIALRAASDRSAFYRCSIKGNQDTLYAYSLRQFYRECDIYGTVDFIFGNAAAVFQSCNIFSLKRGRGSANFITAQGRTDPNQNTGFSIHNCKVTGSIRTYLGRPWKQYSRTVFMQSSLDSSIDPAGWSEWSGSSSLKTLYYGEYMNSGPGAGTAKRVKWPGYHVIGTAAEASKFTVAEFISGNSWLPSTGIAFQSGLIA